MYQINQLSFSYETKEVLKNISVTFPTNKITAIIGPNGCGKSTLLSHLYRLHPSKNKITLNEKPLESYKGREFAQLVAVLTQSRDAMIDDFLVKISFSWAGIRTNNTLAPIVLRMLKLQSII